MKTRRLEQIALAAGLILLGIWGVARLDGVFTSRTAVAKFHASEASGTSGKVSSIPAPVVAVPLVVAPADFSLWSNKRISEYKESLTLKTEVPLAVLRVPKIKLEAPIFDDTDDLTLNRGVGRIKGTSQIGQIGNIGLAGHRDGFFRGLKDIGPGDVLELSIPGRTDQYTVSKIDIVKPDDTSVLKPTATPTLTLVTCYPFYFFGSAPERYIVTASITSSSQPK